MPSVFSQAMANCGTIRNASSTTVASQTTSTSFLRGGNTGPRKPGTYIPCSGDKETHYEDNPNAKINTDCPSQSSHLHQTTIGVDRDDVHGCRRWIGLNAEQTKSHCGKVGLRRSQRGMWVCVLRSSTIRRINAVWLFTTKVALIATRLTSPGVGSWHVEWHLLARSTLFLACFYTLLKLACGLTRSNIEPTGPLVVVSPVRKRHEVQTTLSSGRWCSSIAIWT